MLKLVILSFLTMPLIAPTAGAQTPAPEFIADKPFADRFFKHEQQGGRGGSTVLVCGRAAIAVFVGTSIAGCTDIHGSTYAMVTASTGFALGFHASGFLLAYRSFDGTPVEGTYYGGKVTAAAGRRGGALGFFFKQPDTSENRKLLQRNQLIWLGYAAGATLDITALYVRIYKI